MIYVITINYYQKLQLQQLLLKYNNEDYNTIFLVK